MLASPSRNQKYHVPIHSLIGYVQTMWDFVTLLDLYKGLGSVCVIMVKSNNLQSCNAGTCDDGITMQCLYSQDTLLQPLCTRHRNLLHLPGPRWTVKRKYHEKLAQQWNTEKETSGNETTAEETKKEFSLIKWKYFTKAPKAAFTKDLFIKYNQLFSLIHSPLCMWLQW